MILSEQDAKILIELMWPLHFFANQKLKILPDVKRLDDYAQCSMEEKMEMREHLFSDPKLIDGYVRENPQKLDDDKLQIVSSWKNYCARSEIMSFVAVLTRTFISVISPVNF